MRIGSMALWLASFTLAPLSLASMATAQTAEGLAVWPVAAENIRSEPVSVPLAGAALPDLTRLLMANGQKSAALSPDGSKIAYVNDVSGEPQIWLVEAAGGIPRRLTYGMGTSGLTWTPDGSAILYRADKGGDERYGLYTVTPDGMKEQEVVAQSQAFIFTGDFGPDGQTILYATTGRNGQAFDLYSAALDGSGSRLVAEGHPGLYPMEAQPHGSLVLMRDVRGERGNDLSVIDLATGAEQILFKPESETVYNSAKWTPDGAGFYLATDHERDRAALAHFDMASRQLHVVAEPDGEVETTAISPDGRILVYATVEAGFNRLYAKDMTTGRDLPTPELPRGTYQFRFAGAALRMSILVNGPTTPGEVWIWNLETNEARRAIQADPAGTDLGRLTMPEVIGFVARDGVALSGLLYRPVQTAERAPVFITLHGGPTGYARASWRPDIQFLVSRGIAVLDLNYRGSDMEGRIMASLNDRRLRVNEVRDLADAVAWIGEQPSLDGGRVAIGGHSYGGYLTMAALGVYPDLFVSGVSLAGVADWVRNLENTSPALQASDHYEYGDIHNPDDRAFFASISPISNAARIRTPLLMQASVNDPRNGAGELDDYVAAVRASGGTVAYRRYEGEGHSLADLANIIDFERAKVAFLLEHFGR